MSCLKVKDLKKWNKVKISWKSEKHQKVENNRKFRSSKSCQNVV